MIPEELEKSIQEVKNSGRVPYFVNATSGSTVLGAYDELDKLSDVCRSEAKSSLYFNCPELFK